MIDWLCPVCKSRNMMWDSDEDAEDSGYSVAGIVSFYHCENCGMEAELLVPAKINTKKGNKK